MKSSVKWCITKTRDNYIMISITSTSEMARFQRILEAAQKLTEQSAQRIATGYKINSAADDPSGYQIASGLTRQLRGIETANKNAVMGQSVVKLASDGVESISGYAGEIREIALQALYATDDEKAALELKAQGLMEQMKNVKNGTKFGNSDVFRAEGFTFQTGYSADGVSNLSVETSLEADALNGFDIDEYEIDFTSEDADIEGLIEEFDTLEQDLVMVNAKLGVAENSLEDIIEVQESTYENITGARSQIIDADLTQEVANLSQGEILSEMAVALMQQSMQFNSNLAVSLIAGIM